MDQFLVKVRDPLLQGDTDQELAVEAPDEALALHAAQAYATLVPGRHVLSVRKRPTMLRVSAAGEVEHHGVHGWDVIGT